MFHIQILYGLIDFEYFETAPVNCEWNEWKIGQCSKSCDGGLRNKTRTIMTKESNKGKCEGNATVQETCSLNNCSRQFIFKTYFFIGIYYRILFM